MKNIICFFLAFFCSINILWGQSFGTAELAKAQEEADKMKITKEFRDSQKGIIWGVTAELGGFIPPKVYGSSSMNRDLFPAQATGASSLRINYVKEDILPIGGFFGVGVTNVFYNTLNTAENSNIAYVGAGDNPKYLFIDLGISKNIGTTFTYQMGYRHIFSGKKTESHPVMYEEKSGITSSFIFRQKKSYFGIGATMYLPYYKEHAYIDTDSEYTTLRTRELTPNFMVSISYGFNF